MVVEISLLLLPGSKCDFLTVLSQNEAMMSVHGGAPEKAHD